MVYTYRKHFCGARHLDGAGFARCIWKAADITGRGDYALVSRCSGVVRRVWLFRNVALAEQAASAGLMKCGATCDPRKHQAVMFLVHAKEQREC